MTIDFLKWDSDFFKLKIASATLKPTDEELDIIAELKSYKNQYDLIYINTLGDYFLSEKILIDENIKLVDSKVIYFKDINNEETHYKDPIILYSNKELDPDLCSLALQSGEYSRFKTDSNFPPGTFERFYTKWLENSINGIIADAILIFPEKDRIKGMVTVSIDKNSELLKIGLIAVDRSSQNQGIGKMLMQNVEKYATRQSIKNIEVATQLQNKQACSFYEKCGYSTKLITNIYHYWLK